MLPQFRAFDEDGDMSLGLEEFARMGHWLYDSVSFYQRALREGPQTSSSSEDGSWNDDLISQREWECSAQEISEDQCVVSKGPDQFKVRKQQ